MKINSFLPIFVLTGIFLLIFSSSPFADEENPEKAAMASGAKSAHTETLDEPLFDSQEAALHYKEGVNWYKKRSYSKAIEELESAIEINPDYKEAYYLLGYAYYKEGKLDLSREAFNQAYELDPKYSPLPPK